MKGGFTLPGESGYETLTLDLARRWGADVIRDSDGTQLSPGLLDAGYLVYSTICLIRSVNGWAKENQDKLQQNFLMAGPVLAESGTTVISLLDGYSRDQFRVNGDDGLSFWQVFDRTEDKEVPAPQWSYQDGSVTIHGATAGHQYTVNFLAYRIWEVISMYNHITNGWGGRERLMPVEPRHPEVQRVLLDWLAQWCVDHPHTDVVRFTSMFYNFAWIWSDNPRARDIFSDWGSYDFSVNPLALRLFREETGIDMTAEDFIEKGCFNPTHNAPTEKLRAWMAFTHRFVADFGRQCIEVVHRHGKKAYVFYDDSWIGVEPYGPHFEDFGFDGIIKCVFSGYEARLCAAVPHVKTREIRLHPYLFPTGLKGEPTFAPGGDPTPDLWRYWSQVRRALLRAPIDRIGLGGYLHLVEPFPEFCQGVAEIADGFRALMALHEQSAPRTMPGKVAVLTAWGRLRTWSTSGHLHEHPEIDLTNALEALSGLPVEVTFLSFDDLKAGGIPGDVSVILNAGWRSSAWSGGDAWQDPDIVTMLTRWVREGGGLIGIGEPSAPGIFTPLALGHLFGVQLDDGSRKCLRRFPASSIEASFITAEGTEGLLPLEGVYVDAPDTQVLHAQGSLPMLTARQAGKGRAIYLSAYRFSMEAVRLMHRAVCYAMGAENALASMACGNPLTECAHFASGQAAVINNTAQPQQTTVPGRPDMIRLAPYGQIIL